MARGLMRDPEAARELLAGVGARRTTLQRESDLLKKDTKAALRKTSGVISLTEAARLVGLNRVTLYQEDYVGGGGGGGQKGRATPRGAKGCKRSPQRTRGSKEGVEVGAA